MRTASAPRRQSLSPWPALVGAIAMALLLPAAASAQFRGGGFSQRTDGTAVQGTVQGSIADLDFTKGLVTVRTARGDLTLSAHPQDLRGLNPGDVASLDYYNYNGARWLEPDGFSGTRYRSGTTNGRDFSLSGELTGTVQSVDRQNGTVRVAGHTVRAHPEDVADLYPGQFVQIEYFEVEGERWADSTSTGISSTSRLGTRSGGSRGIGGRGGRGGIP